MTVKLLYFAWVRERIGQSEEIIELPPGIMTVGALIELLQGRGEEYAQAFACRDVVRCAVNQTMAGLDDVIAAGDEVAFFPPVTGG